MDHWGVRVLELLVTPSGAAITLFLVVFVLTLCVFFVRSAREMVREVFTRGMRGRWRDAEIQFGTVETPRPDAPDLTGNVSPAQPGKPESVVPTALPAPAAQEGSEHSGGDDEISMTFRMYEAAFSRDRQALDRAYSDLERLAGRQTTDETLVTLRAELEYRIDREMGLKKLKHVASIHKTWYEPCYKIADIYVDLDQYELAAKWLDEAERRTKDEIDHVRSSLIRAKILIGAESEMRALKYLQEKLEEFSCNENKASA